MLRARVKTLWSSAEELKTAAPAHALDDESVTLEARMADRDAIFTNRTFPWTYRGP